MKIGIVSTSYHPYGIGGGEHSAKMLAEGLQKEGNEVFVISIYNKKTIDEINGVRVYRIKHPNIYWSYESLKQPLYKKLIWHLTEIYNVKAITPVTEILKKERPDILQVRNMQDFSPVIWKVAKENEVPVVQTLNDYTSMCYKSSMFKNGENCPGQCAFCKMVTLPRKKLSKHVNAVVGVSAFTLERHLKYNYFPQARKYVVHTYLKPNPSLLPVSNNKFVTFGYIGKLHPSKGLHLLIDAFNNMQNSASKLLVAGEGPKDYEVLCKSKANTNTKIKFLGKIKSDQFYKEVDVVIIPSQWNEPFPRVLIEAYSHGRPVITSNYGGTPEMVEHGKTGYIFNKNEYMTTLMLKLVHDHSLILQMSRICLELVEKNSKKTDVEKYLDVYKDLAGK